MGGRDAGRVVTWEEEGSVEGQVGSKEERLEADWQTKADGKGGRDSEGQEDGQQVGRQVGVRAGRQAGRQAV